MRLHRLAILLFALGIVGGPAVGRAEDVLARAAVDTTIYRDGEVRRRNEMHGRWSLDCDEVKRLGQRFCSLRSLALDSNGVAVARITISTDERGQPAALLDLPLALDLQQPISVTAARALVVGAPSKALLADARRLAATPTGKRNGKEIGTSLLTADLMPVLCDAPGCQTVWSMAPADIAALRAGAGLRLRYKIGIPAQDPFSPQIIGATRAIEATVSSDGLNDALTASIR